MRFDLISVRTFDKNGLTKWRGARRLTSINFLRYCNLIIKDIRLHRVQLY